ncbi:MAG: hypothetical protein RLZZ623_1015 [Actinomycetota bacterium]|jgi:signal transduction histidine kinase
MDGPGGADYGELLDSCTRALRSGDHRGGAHLAEQILQSVDLVDPTLRADAFRLLAAHRMRLGEPEASGKAGLEALELMSALGDLAGEADVLCTLVMAYDQIGLHQQGMEFALRALDAAQGCGDRGLEALALNRLAVVSQQLGDLDQAIALCEQSLSILRDVDAPDELWATLNNLGHFLGALAARCVESGDSVGREAAVSAAFPLLDEAVALAESDGNEHRASYALSNIAELHIVLGNDDEARRLIAIYSAIAFRLGNRPLLAFAALDEARLLSARGRHVETIKHLMSDEHQSLMQHHSDVARRSVRMLYRSHDALGNHEQALRHLEHYVELARTHLEQRSQAQASMLLARLELYRARAAADRVVLGAEVQRLRADRLAVALDEKAALLSAVSHDLSSPVAAIKTWSFLLHERHEALGVEQREDIALKISREAHRTGQILRDLASADRLIRHAMTVRRESVVMVKVISGALDQIESHTHRVQHEPTLPSLAAIADPGLLGRVLDNLVSNALKYTPAGCTVRVGATAAGDEVHLFVDDDGPGLEPSLRELVFEAYLRGPSSEATAGSGIGLFLVRTFSEAMGGSAWCESGTSTGLRFVVALPKAP